ncbi:MAG: hypothetical protein II781_00590 [Clostridia bacterium]|nr:hypothetical protein [Clostridia bacterium]
MRIRADFTKTVGKIKPMHGIGQPPILGLQDTLFHYIGEAGFPYSRLHDVGGMFGGSRFVDIPNLFPDFDADETLAESYDFVFTDWLIEHLMEQGCEPIFRLGVTIENYVKVRAYRVFPPRDYGKWARICEHVIRHYNEGWADGYTFGIRYWEIWNEPEGSMNGTGGMCWMGTKEEFFRLYETTAIHLKQCFGESIRIGGYASCGFAPEKLDPECKGFANPSNIREYWLNYAHEFLEYISSNEHRAPLDFFSWHSYGSVQEVLRQEDYCRRMLEKHGFRDTEDILDEWNPHHTIESRGTPAAAAGALAVMLGMQKKPVGLLAYYDGRIGPSQYGGLFNPDTWKPYLTYYAFRMFNQAYRLGQETETFLEGEGIFVLGAAAGERKILLLANPGEEPVEAELMISGADPLDAEIFRIDAANCYSPTGERIRDGRLNLPACSCTEIRW